jgi:hypothetical protein
MSLTTRGLITNLIAGLEMPRVIISGRGVFCRLRNRSEIEYVFGMLKTLNVPWQPADWKLSDVMITYWSNFARTGNPNGAGLPQWPAYNEGHKYQVMHLDTDLRAAPDAQRARYEFLDAYTAGLTSR